jgi:hypothetical protein
MSFAIDSIFDIISGRNRGSGGGGKLSLNHDNLLGSNYLYMHTGFCHYVSGPRSFPLHNQPHRNRLERGVRRTDAEKL